MQKHTIIGLVIAVGALIAVVMFLFPAVLQPEDGPLPLEPGTPDEVTGYDTDPRIEADDYDPDPVGAELQEDPYGDSEAELKEALQ